MTDSNIIQGLPMMLNLPDLKLFKTLAMLKENHFSYFRLTQGMKILRREPQVNLAKKTKILTHLKRK